MNLNIFSDRLQIELDWFEQLWAFSWLKVFEIPLSHLDKVTNEEPKSNWSEIRAPGTFIPGIIKAGTYYTRKGKEFWYVTKDQDYLVLELNNETYRRMIFTLNDSEIWQLKISQAKAALVN